ncbi:MAG: M12 family metallo-peptidase [Opitutales bacterium]
MGQVAGAPNSSVVLTRWKGALYGSVEGMPEGSYELRSRRDGPLELFRILNEHQPGCEMTDADFVQAALSGPDNFAATSLADVTGDSPIDIVIGYNDQARVILGGSVFNPNDNGAIEAKILTAVANANIAYDNSNIQLDLRLAWLGQIDYVYPAGETFNRALNEIIDPDDGNADRLAVLKALYQADFASMWLESSVSGGRASVLLSALQRDRAYNVVRAQNSTLTFVHEVGHNQGCRHIRSSYSSTPSSWTPYAFAHQFTGSDLNVYLTVMASVGNTQDAGGTRILHFSNPDVLFQSVPTGLDAVDDTARTLNENATTYSAFYEAPRSEVSIMASATEVQLGQSFSFVGESYELRRTTDPSQPGALWDNLGTFMGDNSGDLTASDNGNGLPNAFYQWRQP